MGDTTAIAWTERTWTVGSLFAGIGGLELGLERAGLTLAPIRKIRRKARQTTNRRTMIPAGKWNLT